MCLLTPLLTITYHLYTNQKRTKMFSSVIALALAALIVPAYGQTAGGACMDLVFALDTSCSTSSDQQRKAKEIMIDIVSSAEITIGINDTRVAALTFNKGTQHQFYLDKYDNKNDITNAIDSIPTAPVGCRTHTFNALKKIAEDYLSLLENGQRAERPDIVVLFTDGVTYPIKKQHKTLEYAQALKDMGVLVFIVEMNNERNNDGRPEYNAIASQPLADYLIMMNEDVPKRFFAKVPRPEECLPEAPPTCDVKQDIVMVMDKSNSIAEENLDTIIDFFVKVASSFEITPDTTRISAISYNKQVQTHFLLDGHMNKLHTLNWLSDKLRTELELGQKTRTDKALLRATEILQTYGRKEPGVAKTIFIATDGTTFPVDKQPMTFKAAEAAHAAGISVFLVKLPNLNGKNSTEEFEAIASKPLKTHLFDEVESFDKLEGIVRTLTGSVCAVAQSFNRPE
ncbi:unnamed protein product [Owenia fusiformis]|uniref:Uncharacterized protein n=1 Tax=Owenia fusiformis TaxID=6347 RepID=A0A8J1TWX3_OWEFU|nr:unnamed protein product [Owenia fusiformis]